MDPFYVKIEKRIEQEMGKFLEERDFQADVIFKVVLKFLTEEDITWTIDLLSVENREILHDLLEQAVFYFEHKISQYGVED